MQEYLSRPFLIDGFKFDLRVYVLVTSCSPMRVYLYKDGLVRLSTQPYKAPTQDNIHMVRECVRDSRCALILTSKHPPPPLPSDHQLNMHLTNYSVNKHHEGMVKEAGEGRGGKRRGREESRNAVPFLMSRV